MITRIHALAAATVLAVAGVPGTGPAAAGAVPTGALAGSIVSADGTPGSGATVEVFAWPDESVGDAIPADGFADTPLVGTTAADTAGNYAVTPDLTSLDDRYVSRSGAVDVELRVRDEHGLQDWFATWQGIGQHISFDMAARTVDSSAGSGPEQVPVDVVAADADALPPPPTCTGWQAKEYVTSRPEKFVNAYGRPHAPLQVTERVGASHSLGVALKIEGGGWGLDGSSGLEVNNGAGGSQTFRYERLVYNSVNYRHWHLTCMGLGAHDRDLLRPSGFYDLISQWPSIAPTTWIYCVTKSSGQWWKSHGSNTTYSAGVSLPYLDVSAHVSFSTDFELMWHPDAPVWLCGSTSLGWAEAPQAAAKKIETDGGCRPPGPCLDGRRPAEAAHA